MYTHIVSLNVNWKLASACQPYATIRSTDGLQLPRFEAVSRHRLSGAAMIRLNTSVALSVWGEFSPFAMLAGFLGAASFAADFVADNVCYMEVDFANEAWRYPHSNFVELDLNAVAINGSRLPS